MNHGKISLRELNVEAKELVNENKQLFINLVIISGIVGYLSGIKIGGILSIISLIISLIIGSLFPVIFIKECKIRKNRLNIKNLLKQSLAELGNTIMISLIPLLLLAGIILFFLSPNMLIGNVRDDYIIIIMTFVFICGIFMVLLLFVFYFALQIALVEKKDVIESIKLSIKIIKKINRNLLFIYVKIVALMILIGWVSCLISIVSPVFSTLITELPYCYLLVILNLVYYKVREEVFN